MKGKKITIEMDKSEYDTLMSYLVVKNEEKVALLLSVSRKNEKEAKKV